MSEPVVGRPRDPSVEPRLHRAACQVYGDVGWAGFTVELVARTAKVGKPSVYRRWTSKAALLRDSLQVMLSLPTQVEHGSVREDLTEVVSHLLALYASDVGQAARRLSVEASTTPELTQLWQEMRARQIAGARTIVLRGIERGELPPDVSVGLLLEALLGGALMHSMATDGGDPSPRAHQTYARRLVELVLPVDQSIEAPRRSTAAR